MLTLYEMEERAELVHSRMADIVKEMAQMSEIKVDIQKSLALLDEMMTLAQESRTLKHSLEQFRDMAEQLISSPCSGPH